MNIDLTAQDVLQDTFVGGWLATNIVMLGKTIH
jgi:hypothetical protein